MHKHRNSNDISSIATIEEEEEVSRNGIGNGIATSSSASSASGPARLHIRNQSNAHPEQRPRGVSLSRQTVLNRQRERGFSLSSSTSSQPGGGAFSSSRGRRTRRLRVFWTRHYRRILLAAFLSLLGWSLYTHRDEAIRDVTVLSKRSSGYAASLTGGGAAASKAALRARPASVRRALPLPTQLCRESSRCARQLSSRYASHHFRPQKRSTSDLPFARQEFRMQEPTYEILILQSTIQHQNTTWRQTVTQNGASWIVQSIGWIRVVRPRPFRPSLRSPTRRYRAEWQVRPPARRRPEARDDIGGRVVQDAPASGHCEPARGRETHATATEVRQGGSQDAVDRLPGPWDRPGHNPVD